ncbi:MAG: GNAT family N-acetyltransferase [Lachnospiraceae bacterium]|nr:GNAT family N-acetyltransferase [Lachnospiraceae bacterium]
MEQLRMRCAHLKEVPENLKEGFHIISADTDKYTKEEIKLAWTAICEELNEKFDESIYGSLMLSDPYVEENNIFFVEDPDGRLISTATILKTEDPNEAILHMVGTLKSGKGQGAGGAVCAHCVNEALKQGITSMRLKTDEFRVPAIKIYYKLGFLPNLFQDDMRARWSDTLRGMGWESFHAINENGEIETIWL